MRVPPTEPSMLEPLDAREPDPRFHEELETVSWLQHEVRLGNPLPVLEAEAVAHSLHVALGEAAAGGGAGAAAPARIPQLPVRRMAEYVAVHAINVSLLVMAFAEHAGLESGDVRELGLAGLLHDIGMARVPLELLAKADQLSAEERTVIEQHPVEGARIIVQAAASLELAAVVAYEHHLRLDGHGYPSLTFPREAHHAARLVQLCDVYHALHSPRPYRQSWPQDIVAAFLNERAGTEFDPELTRAFTALLQERGAQP